MSNLFNQASLVLVPSGYKEDIVYSQVPTNGDGDLTFTRASDATRVNSAGLIERVPWNLLEQSNTFSTTWLALFGGAVTSGQSGYDGTNNAWSLSKTAANGEIRQTVLLGLRTFSVYAKAGSLNWLYLLKGGNAGQFFNLSTGQVGTGNAQVISANIQSVGGGWYLCSMVYNDDFNGSLRIYPADADNDTSGTSGNIYIQDAQLNEGSTAKPYFPTTDRLNVPRLDYSGGGCPSLLLEPQRTNLFVQSENFDSASWTKVATSVSANTTTSPDGTTNADTLTSTATSFVLSLQTLTIVSGTTYTTTFYAKQNTQRFIYIRFTSNGTSQNYVTAVFDLQDGTLGETSVGTTSGTLVSATATSSANGFYRITVIASITLTDGNVGIGFAPAKTGNAFNSYGAITSAITSGNSLFIYGAQLEAGAYSTSYIPTLGATVTRLRDRCIKTNFTGLSSQSELTLYTEFVYNQVGRIIAIGDGTASNRLFVSYTSTKQIQLYLNVGGTLAFFLTSSIDVLLNGKNKVAVKIKSGETLLYVNGIEIFNNTSTFTLANLNNIYIGTVEFSDSDNGTQDINSSLIFYSALTNSELASITGNQNYTINQAYANYGVASESPNCVLP